jgi:hypothetical protein
MELRLLRGKGGGRRNKGGGGGGVAGDYCLERGRDQIEGKWCVRRNVWTQIMILEMGLLNILEILVGCDL